MYSTKDRRSSVNRTLSAPDLVGKVGAHAVRTPRAPQSFVVGRLVPKATDPPRGQLLVEVEGIYACADINRRICEEGPLVVLAFVRQWQQQHPHSRTKVRDLHNRLRDLKERRPSWRHSEMERGAKKEIEAHAHGGLQPDLAVLFMGRREFLLEPPKEWKGPKDRSYWAIQKATCVLEESFEANAGSEGQEREPGGQGEESARSPCIVGWKFTYSRASRSR